MAERSELDSTTEKKVKPDPAPHCHACGTFLIPGITCKKTTRSRRKQHPALSKSATKVEPLSGSASRKVTPPRGPLETVVVEECLACYRSTVHVLPATTRYRSVTDSGVVDKGGHASKQLPSRNRKKRPRDLQSKMKADEEKAKASRGMDLMDFLKPVQ